MYALDPKSSNGSFGHDIAINGSDLHFFIYAFWLANRALVVRES